MVLEEQQKTAQQIMSIKEQHQEELQNLQHQFTTAQERHVQSNESLREDHQKQQLESTEMKFRLREAERKNKLLEQEYNATTNLLEKTKLTCKALEGEKLELMDQERQQTQRIKMLELEVSKLLSEREEKSKTEELMKEQIAKQDLQIKDLRFLNEKLEKKLCQSGEETTKANDILELMDQEIQKKKHKLNSFKSIIIKQESKIEELQF